MHSEKTCHQRYQSGQAHTAVCIYVKDALAACWLRVVAACISIQGRVLWPYHEIIQLCQIEFLQDFALA